MQLMSRGIRLIYFLTACHYAYVKSTLILNNNLLTNDVMDVSKISKTCNHKYINQTFGILTSPNYPLGYHGNMTCTWTINMPQGERVALTIKSFFLGPRDKVQIIEKYDVVTYSLVHPPNDVIFSSSNSFVVKLYSTDIIDTGNNSNHTFYAIFEREGCGGIMTLKNGYITVPSYIYISANSHECSWTILAPHNKVLVLQFLQFDLPPGSCIYNNIYIRDGSKDGGYILGDFCEENPPMNQLRTSTNIMHIAYRTRPSILSLNPNIIPSVKMYYSQEDACGGVLDGFSGSFALPRRWLEDAYVCNWTIKAPRGKHLLLKLRDWKSTGSDLEYDEVKFILPHTNIVYWKSKGLKSPPSTMIVPSNELIVSLTSHRNGSATTMLRFNCVYQSTAPAEDRCISVAGGDIFLCDEWKYIDCDLRCNGVYDCRNKRDESYCMFTNPEVPIAMQHHADMKKMNWTGYIIAIFTVGCLVGVIAFLSITTDRFYRKKNKQTPRDVIRKYPPPLSPPPYVPEERLYQSSNSTYSAYKTPTSSFNTFPRYITQCSTTSSIQHPMRQSRSGNIPYRSKSSNNFGIKNLFEPLVNKSSLSLNGIQPTTSTNDIDKRDKGFGVRNIRQFEQRNTQSTRDTPRQFEQPLTPTSSQPEILSAWEYLFPNDRSACSQSSNSKSLRCTPNTLSKERNINTLEEQRENNTNDQVEEWSYESDFEECSSTTDSTSSFESSITDIKEETSSDEESQKITDDATTELFHNTDVLLSTNEYVSDSTPFENKTSDFSTNVSLSRSPISYDNSPIYKNNTQIDTSSSPSKCNSLLNSPASNDNSPIDTTNSGSKSQISNINSPTIPSGSLNTIVKSSSNSPLKTHISSEHKKNSLMNKNSIIPQTYAIDTSHDYISYKDDNEVKEIAISPNESNVSYSSALSSESNFSELVFSESLSKDDSSIQVASILTNE